ncbi:MAG TPA: hypothetical protein VIJ38_07410 [Acidobacteriaceae bacterium]
MAALTEPQKHECWERARRKALEEAQRMFFDYDKQREWVKRRTWEEYLIMVTPPRSSLEARIEKLETAVRELNPGLDI